MTTTLRVMALSALVASFCGIDAKARLEPGAAVLGGRGALEMSGLERSSGVIRFGVGGDVDLGAAGAGAIAADAATQIRHMESDLSFAFGVVGAMPTHALTTVQPPEQEMSAASLLALRLEVQDALVMDGAKAAQEETGEIEKAMLEAASLSGRAENRMKLDDGQSELACLAEAIYYEARGESINGQIAVAEVIVNRADSPIFPSTICGVVSQGANRLNSCQFSYKCDGKPERMADRKARKRAMDVAILLMKGDRRRITDGATHYHADYVSPGWSKRLFKTTEIGTHIFYRRNTRTASLN